MKIIFEMRKKMKRREGSEISNQLKGVFVVKRSLVRRQVIRWRVKGADETQFTSGNVIDMVTMETANSIEEHDEVNNLPSNFTLWRI